MSVKGASAPLTHSLQLTVIFISTKAVFYHVSVYLKDTLTRGSTYKAIGAVLSPGGRLLGPLVQNVDAFGPPQFFTLKTKLEFIKYNSSPRFEQTDSMWSTQLLKYFLPVDQISQDVWFSCWATACRC